ncbi:protein phosphatase 2C domain-containing protein [Corynebacterium singulare]|uniref:Serine/threonine protein phosphatase n=1 Tax=Corynebacterium singulare TaxID=161899 RepID=A0A0B6EXF6_9CORY|nr:protein phosphatase 2C domain-containing protein [Corynebacterium singulare]AJI77604.1 serine/threonine protein phosphatase [Corynebacterium singulare]
MTLSLKFTAVTDRGLVRGNNEDSAHAGPHLLVLADGMGGHAAGEVASTTMVEHMASLERDPGDNDMLALLGAAAEDANAAIRAHVDEHPETEGMGTTLTAMLFNGSTFGVCHVGDSRGYRLRDGKLSQITKDDTYVQSLVDEGKLDPEDVSSHPQKSLILKAYTGRPVEPTLFTLDAQPGDRILLCSDGLSDPVTASTIEQALGQGSVEEASIMLRDLALRSGGPDNVTIVVAEVVDAVLDDASPITVGAIQGVVPDPTHPDSSASRAAKLVSPPKAKAAEVTPREDSEEEPQRPPRRSRVGWKVIASLAVVLVIVISGGLWMKNHLANNYYVTTDEEEVLTIQQGADFEIFGRPLHHTYQHACLSEKNALKLGRDDCGGDYAPFKLADLPESERAAVGNLPAGSYDEVQTQLSRLSEKALKPCAKATSKEAEVGTKKSTDKGSATDTKKDAATPAQGKCREVK